MATTGEEKEIMVQFEDGLDHAPPRQQESSAACGGGDGGRCVIGYRECLKNHAAGIGGNVTDGCTEFMPGGVDGTEQSLKCAACDCHRNFHRKGGGGGAPPPTPPTLPSFASMTQWSNPWASLALQSAKTAAFGGGEKAAQPPPPPYTAADSSSEYTNFNAYQDFCSAPTAAPPPSAAEIPAKKRVRTKFTAEQKEEMMRYAERIGWRMPKEEESIKGVESFCGEIGVKRQVFKVWMHNNRNLAANKNNCNSSQSSLNN